MNEPPPAPAVVQAVTAAAGGTAPRRWWRSSGGGYSPAQRWLVELADGTRAFAKVGTVERVVAWLRVEHRAYRELAAPFMPRILGWSDGPVPALLLEDLSGARWPPPWDPELVDRVVRTLDGLAATPAPAWARPIEEVNDFWSGWSRVAADPKPFLGLGLASRAWLEAALPTLVAHERPDALAGTSLLHMDVRSDNLCLSDDRLLLVDWNWIARGNPLFDVAAWLPSLAAEGGPLPEEVAPEAGVFATAVAGYFCAQAPLPPIPDVPGVRNVQLAQALIALPWAARWLGLPPPDGRRVASGW